jgi:hypothetical protein
MSAKKRGRDLQSKPDKVKMAKLLKDLDHDQFMLWMGIAMHNML